MADVWKRRPAAGAEEPSEPTADVPSAVGVASHCPYCALQCGIEMSRDDEGAIRVAPRDFPTNRGGLCQKGWTSAALLNHPERLKAPLLRARRGAPAERVTWAKALGTVAGRLRALRDEYGPDSVAIFGGGGLTNEKAYLLGKFARVVLGTSQIDYNGRFCMSSAAAAGIRAFGIDRGMPFPVTDLDDSQVVVLAGANPAETMPPLMGHLRTAKLIVIDPRVSATAERALAGGGLHLAPVPGTDMAVALGLLHLVVTEGLLRKDFVETRTGGFDDAWAAAASWWPERVERVTGVSVADLRAAAMLLAGAQRSHILTGRGVEQHADGTDTATAWINLALALGLPGRTGSGYGCITGQGNGQGGREHGQKADQLPGYRKLTDPAAREYVAGVWGVPPESLPGPGRSAYELLDALGQPGGPRALLVFGANPAVSGPNAGHIRRRLAALDLLVVADLVPSETAQLADVVFPVTQWAEEEGTMTNLEGRLLRRRRAVHPPLGVRSDLEVLSGLALRLGAPRAAFPADPKLVFAELRRASAGGVADYSGITYERLDAGEQLHWPVPEGGDGTPRLFLDRFAHPDGRARFVAVGGSVGPAEPPDTEYPLYGTTGRVLTQYQSGAQTRRVAELSAASPESFVETHPDTAARYGLADGDLARVVSRRGAAVARIRCVATMRTDTVFVPFHFGADASANLFTNPALDPTSRMPEFKVCAVRLERHEQAPADETGSSA